MDNAIEAAEKLPLKERMIKLKMRTINHCFFLEIENGYIGERNKDNKRYYTSKKNKELHGIGIESCKSIVAKYDGDLKILDDGSKFKIEIGIYQQDK